MGLSAPQPRQALHRRTVELDGYERADGLFDIEAKLADVKTYGFTLEDRGWLSPGERLHGMTMRLTVDLDLTIIACEASMDETPYAYCPSVAPNFARLAGLKIGRGFLKAAAERVGGTAGCTHLRELLQPLATVAFQTVYAKREARSAGSPPGEAPALLGTCHAFAPDSPVVARRWPDRYAGPSEAPPE